MSPRGLGEVLLGVVLVCAAASTCGGSAALTTSPSPAKCAVTAVASLNQMDGTGGSNAVTVSTQTECAWTAAAQAGWITNLTPTSGQGSGQVKFQVGANPSHSARQGEVVINDTRVQVGQDRAPCHSRPNQMAGTREAAA